MKFLITLFAFSFSLNFLQAHATVEYGHGSVSSNEYGKDPFKKYKKAKQRKALDKMSMEDRLLILNTVWKDTTDMYWISDVERDEMVKEVILTTPENKIPELFKLFGTDVKEFQNRFNYLPFEQMSFILNYVKPSLHKREIDSQIFNIPHELFEEQLKINIENEGDNLFQSHYTDFCGKVAVIRLWIKYNPDDYAAFMTSLYYNGKAKLNGIEFKTPNCVIAAINGDDICADPNQKITFKNPEVSEKMPEMMDMVLYLTLASSFHTFPFNNVEYKPGKHLENSAWAGAALKPEVNFLTAMGFHVQKLGDNFRGISDSQFEIIKNAGASDSKQRVMLLVNSSMLDTISGASKEYNMERQIEHKSFGTHWITVNEVDQVNDKISFWEYGKTRTVIGISRMKSVIAGGIIIYGYEPK